MNIRKMNNSIIKVDQEHKQEFYRQININAKRKKQKKISYNLQFNKEGSKQ